MAFVYACCVMMGGSVLALRYLLRFMEFTADHGGHPLRFVEALLGQLTLLFAGVFVAGVVGMAGTAAGWDDGLTLFAALLLGFAPAAILTLLQRLDADGRRRKQAENKTGLVRETVPALRSGKGVVVLLIGREEIEYTALTGGSDLQPGTRVKVTSVLDAETVEVLAEVEQDPLRQALQPRSSAVEPPG